MKENEGLVKQKWPAIQAKEALLEKEADKEVAEASHVLHSQPSRGFVRF